MTDDLTERLHAGVGQLPVSPRTAEQVRRSAEKSRRARRFGLVVGGSLVVLAVAAGSALLPDTSPSTLRAPASTPTLTEDRTLRTFSQLAVVRDRDVVVVIESTGYGDRTPRTLEIALERAIPSERGRCTNFTGCGNERPRRRPWPGRHTLATDPLLTDADWLDIADGVRRTGSYPSPLTACVPDPRTPQASESFAAAYAGQTAHDINEFVLRYPDVKTASRALNSLRHRFMTCPGNDSATLLPQELGVGGWTADEFFVAEG